jgi:RimJ/RimL family protein N-acetyltransferase
VKLERMDGPRVRLAPVTPADHAFLYNLATSDENAYRWILRGAIPPFEQFIEQHGPGFATSFTVWLMETGERIGQALIYNIDLRNGHLHLGVAVTPDNISRGLGRESLGVLIGYAFAVYPVRKLYAEGPGFTFSGVELGVTDAPVMDLFAVEGRLRDHLYVDGEYHDLYLVSFARRHWKGLDAFLAAWLADTTASLPPQTDGNPPSGAVEHGPVPDSWR